MAYGKDNSQLGRVVPYGGSMSQRAKHYTNSKKQAAESRRGGGAPYWKDTLKCPKDHSRIIRLIPGQYEQEVSYDDETVVTDVFEYFMFREHYHGVSGRGGICSAGPLYKSKKEAQPCEGCTMFWEDVRERRAKKTRGDKSKGPNRISMRDQYIFTAWDYGLWLKVPRTDQNGNVITGQQGTPFYDWVMAQPNDPRVSQLEHKFGALVAWPVGETYKDTLLQYNDLTVCKDCATCGTQGSIQCVSKICGNPECEHPIYDPNDTTMTPEQIEKLDSELYNCPVCNQTSFINEMVECATCFAQGSEPRRASIFDIDLEITAVASGKGTQTSLQILNRSTPRPLQIADPELLKTVVPMNLSKKFGPTPIEKQRELWGVSAPAPNVQQPGQAAAATGPSMPSMQQPATTQPATAMPAMSAPALQQPATAQPPQVAAQPAAAPAMPTMSGGFGANLPGLPGGGIVGGRQ